MLDLDKISALTLAHYNQRADDFREGTRDHDVSQNIGALLRHITGIPPFAILDFGCGPGRDLQVFTGLGHCAVGLEGAERFGNRIFSSWIFRTSILTAYSPMRPCFMCRPRNYRACYGNCMPL